MPVTRADVTKLELAWAAAKRLPTKEARNARAREIFVEYKEVIDAVAPDVPVGESYGQS